MDLASVDKAAGSRHFAPLDGLRGIAILSVIATHAYRHTGRDHLSRVLDAVAHSGWVGVTLFFVLSGFLISGILLDCQQQPRWWFGFMARRVLRIFPLYFAFLSIYWFVLPHWKWAAARLCFPSGSDVICYWTYVANMREFITGRVLSCPTLDPIWSLSVEEQVYLVWPLVIALASHRVLPRLLVATLAASFMWKLGVTITGQSIELRYCWTPACLDAFAAGALVAWLSRSERLSVQLKTSGPRLAACLGCFLSGMALGQGHFNFWLHPTVMLTIGSTAIAIFFAAVIAVLVAAPDDSLMNRVLSMRWLRFCGQYSYAAYLFHTTVLALLRPLFPGWNAAENGWNTVPQALLFVLGVGGVSFLLAWLSWNLLERHFLALKKYFPGSSRVVRLAPRTD